MFVIARWLHGIWNASQPGWPMEYSSVTSAQGSARRQQACNAIHAYCLADALQPPFLAPGPSLWQETQ